MAFYQWYCMVAENCHDIFKQLFPNLDKIKTKNELHFKTETKSNSYSMQNYTIVQTKTIKRTLLKKTEVIIKRNSK